jgi:hypothetical protein
MGTGIIVHGYITCPGWGHQDSDRRVFHHNAKIIDQLPISDPEWPFITRTMFSALPLRTSLEKCVPQYETQIIHFAGSYKDMFSLSAEWLTKFEKLLSQLCWFNANVIASSRAFQWAVEMEKAAELYRQDPPTPPDKWHFGCVELFEKELNQAEAIVGEFISKHHIN